MRQRHVCVIDQRLLAADDGIGRNAEGQRAIIDPIVVRHEVMAFNATVVKGQDIGVRFKNAEVFQKVIGHAVSFAPCRAALATHLFRTMDWP